MEPSQALTDAERVASFVLARTVEKAGPRARQARRKIPALDPRELGAPLGPALTVLAHEEILCVPKDASDGLFGIARGTHRADVLAHVPSPAELLARQARGIRVVSLLTRGEETAPHADALAFAVHDLCHLDKFQVDHEGQVGFFAMMQEACILHASAFDETWRRDVIAVVTDMNGSPVFLLAALKMRMKMAVRRKLAREDGALEKRSGPLDEREEAAWQSVLEEFLTQCDLSSPARDAAREITARRVGTERAHIFLDEMAARGRASLARARQGTRVR